MHVWSAGRRHLYLFIWEFVNVNFFESLSTRSMRQAHRNIFLEKKIFKEINANMQFFCENSGFLDVIPLVLRLCVNP